MEAIVKITNGKTTDEIMTFDNYTKAITFADSLKYNLSKDCHFIIETDEEITHVSEFGNRIELK